MKRCNLSDWKSAGEVQLRFGWETNRIGPCDSRLTRPTNPNRFLSGTLQKEYIKKTTRRPIVDVIRLKKGATDRCEDGNETFILVSFLSLLLISSRSFFSILKWRTHSSGICFSPMCLPRQFKRVAVGHKRGSPPRTGNCSHFFWFNFFPLILSS